MFCCFQTPSVEMNLNQEQPLNEQNQSQTNPTVGTTNATPPKVKIMKPPKKNRKPPSVCENQGEATPSQKFFNS